MQIKNRIVMLVGLVSTVGVALPGANADGFTHSAFWATFDAGAGIGAKGGYHGVAQWYLHN